MVSCVWLAATTEQRRLDALRLLRQVPATIELAQLDFAGKKRLHVARVAMDVVDSRVDRSNEAANEGSLADFLQGQRVAVKGNVRRIRQLVEPMQVP